MKFSTRIDKEVTAERMFDALADFDRIERILMRRGVSVNRVDNISAGARPWSSGSSATTSPRALPWAACEVPMTDIAIPTRRTNWPAIYAAAIIVLGRQA